MSRRDLARVAATGFAALVAAAAPGGPARPPAGVREAVYFGSGGPVRIRFHATFAGRPADEVWAEAVGKLFAFCDRNGDGVLDAAELAALNPPKRRAGAAAGLPAPSEPLLQLTFGRREGPVSREAFAAAVGAAGYGPVSFTFAVARTDSARLSAALFRHLDADGDGKLSADELRAARERLAPLDTDEDEYLTADELLGRAARRPDSGAGIQATPARRQDAPSAESRDFVLSGPDPEAATKQLLAARGGARATSLSRREFGADPRAFAALDQDSNGKLDPEELAAWFRQPPDVDLALELRSGRQTLAPIGQLGPGFGVDAGGAVAGTLSGALFRFEPPGAGTTGGGWNAVAEQLRGQFRQLAKGKDFATREEFVKQPSGLALFDFADRAARGRVTGAEFEAALEVLRPLATCRVEIRLIDQGSGLFELLDRNGDGRLSPRELAQAPAVLRPFADASGRVGPADLKRRFLVRAAAGGVPAVVVPAAGVEAAAAKTAGSAEAVPAWFAKMDRNGDGDVSLREFLGPLELFRKLDRDGDGLISPEEARAAGK